MSQKTWGHWRRNVAAFLARIGLLKPAFRLYELSFALRSRASGREDSRPDGVPLPPAWMRARVGPNEVDPQRFLAIGLNLRNMIESVLRSANVDVEETHAILDFGCGCGRVTRHWRSLDGPAVHGTDIDRRLVEWCRKNLGFTEFSVNGLSPPLNYPAETFGLVYALSVFTHLSRELEVAWIEELTRVLRPGGYLLISTKGEHALGGLNDEEKAAFGRGEPVYIWEEAAGTGLSNVWHPPEYVRETLAGELEHVRLEPGRIGQDVHLLRKPA